MNKNYISTGLAGLLALLVIISSSIYFGLNKKRESVINPEIEKPVQFECNQDAKICADGSTVGRTGPSCAFAACPASQVTYIKDKTSLGGTVTGLNVSVTPKSIVSDSRCPSGVQCIWAGTVEVNTVISTKVSRGEYVLKLNSPQIFGDYVITFVNVTPTTKQGEEITDSAYRFEFEIKKK